MLHNKLMLAVLLAIMSSTYAMGQQPNTTTTDSLATGAPEQTLPRRLVGDKAPQWLKDVSSRLNVHGYAQGGYNYTHQAGDDKNTFELKRALLFIDARITDRWSFLFMHDFSSVVQEYYTDFRITRNKALTVRIGQYKNAYTLENPLSPTNMETIDVYSEGVTYLAGCGSDPLFGVQYGRDMGLSLFGETNNGFLAYTFQVMNGRGVNKKDDNPEKDFIARLELRPAKGLNIVATGQVGRGHAQAASPYNPDILPGQNYKRNRWSLGAQYTASFARLHGEVLQGWDGKATSWGAYVTGSVPLGVKGLEAVASYDFFNFNTSLGMDQHKAVAGLQYWFFGRCRAQVQYVYKSAYLDGGRFVHGNSHALMCQMQVRFN